MQILYFSWLRERVGEASEDIETAAATPADLIAELKARGGGHAMAFANERAEDYAPEFDVIGAVGSGAGVVDGEPFVPVLLGSSLRGIMVVAMIAQQEAYGPDIAPPTRLLTEFADALAASWPRTDAVTSRRALG